METVANTNTDRIERKILLKAPRARVWRALTDPAEFGSWFGIKVEPVTVAPGARLRGFATVPGYEHIVCEMTIDRMEPERLFSWRWHPGAVDTLRDYSKDPTTLVVFTLDDQAGGTLLTVVESGFDQVPHAYRAASFRLNTEGWDEQMVNIERHVGTAAS